MAAARYLHLQLTERCNLACPGCYLPERSGPGRTPEEIDERVFQPLAEAGVRYVTLTGGEPLLHPRWLDICAAAARRFTDVQLVTNGLLLGLESYEALRDAGLRSLKVSLDGPGPETHDALRGMRGAFERTTANLRAIAALPQQRRGGVDVGCICTVHPANVGQLADVAALADGLGLDSVLFQPFHPYDLLYPPVPDSDGPARSAWPSESGRPRSGPKFLETLAGQLRRLRALRQERPGFLDNSLAMLDAFASFYTDPQGPQQVCGADRFVFVNSELEVRGCLFCRPLGGLEQGLEGLRAGTAWRGFDAFRRGCRRCLMGCQWVDRAKDLAEEGFGILDSGDAARALERFDASLALEFSPTAAHGAGLSRLRLGRAGEARPLLEAALAHRPQNLFVLGDLGQAHLRLKDWPGVEAMAARLAELAQGRGKAAQLRGLARLAQGDAEGAVAHLRVALELGNTREPWPHFEYGLALLQAGRHAEAEGPLRAAAERDPGFPWFRYRLALALRGQGRLAEAREACAEALRLDSGPEAFHALKAELDAETP